MPRREKRGGPRGMWTGTVSFGLVSVPVSLFPALRRRATHLRMLDTDGTPLQRQYVCPKDGQALSSDDIIRGYETEDGKMLTIRDEELEALAPEKTNDITLKEFVRIEEVPVFHFDRPYFLAPSGRSSKAYRLLARVMEDRQRAGIGSFVMREKEYLVALLAKGGILMAETLRFADEIRSPEDLGLPEPAKVAAKDLKSFESSIKALSRKTLDENELKDTYAEAFERLIDKKRKSGDAVVRIDVEEEEETENVVDLVAVFRERMRQAQDAEKPVGETSRAKVPPDLNDLTKEELYERAKAKNIPGRSKMSKEELVQALVA